MFELHALSGSTTGIFHSHRGRCPLLRPSARKFHVTGPHVQTFSKYRSLWDRRCKASKQLGNQRVQPRCQATSSSVADLTETVYVTDSDVVPVSTSEDSSAPNAVLKSIEELSANLALQLAQLGEYTSEDKERIEDSKQQHRKAIDEKRLLRKQARAASRSSAAAIDAASADRQNSHAQASSSSPAKVPAQVSVSGTRQTKVSRGRRPTVGRPARTATAKATAAAAAEAAAAASTNAGLAPDGSQARLGKAKSRANRSGRVSAWGMHVEAESPELVTGRRTAPSNAEAGYGTALGGLVKRSNQLLTAAEEYELTTHVKDLLKCVEIKDALTKELGRPPETQEWAAALGETDYTSFRTRVETGVAAKRKMIQCNQRLVMSIARKYLGRGMELSDMVAEGITGLIKGVDRFDHTRGFKFSTYAHWWIRQAINRAICEQGRVVRLPVHLHEVQMKVYKAEKELIETLQREPTQEEVAKAAGITGVKLHAVRKAHRQHASLEAPLKSSSEGAENTLADFIEDEAVTLPGEAAVHKMLTQDMNNLLYTLSERESEVLRLRYGLDDGHERTLEEVGRVMLVTRERIRQIEFKALRKLKDPQRCSTIKEYAEQPEEELPARAQTAKKSKAA